MFFTRHIAPTASVMQKPYHFGGRCAKPASNRYVHDTQRLGNVIPHAPFTSITFQWLLVGCRYMRPYTLPLWTTGLSGFAEASGIASGLQTRIGTSCGPPEKKQRKKCSYQQLSVKRMERIRPVAIRDCVRSFDPLY